MPEVPFTQYLRPNGSRRPISINRPTEMYLKAMRLIEAGYRFEVEVLTTGQVSLTCVDPEDSGDIAIEVCANNSEVSDKVDAVIEKAWEHANKVRIRISV